MPRFTDNLAALFSKSMSRDSDLPEEFDEDLYQDMHREAERQFQNEGLAHTLQPTALVHESFLRLVNQGETDWQNRQHFLSIASQMMRRVLIDHARRRLRIKRQGKLQNLQRVRLDDVSQVPTSDPEGLLVVHDLLQELEQLDARQARIVELRFFAGMTNPEIARAIGVSLRTVEAEWAMARAWFQKKLCGEG